MLADNADSIEAFKATREAAFDAERADWEAKGEFARVEALSNVADDTGDATAIVAPEGSDQSIRVGSPESPGFCQ